MCASATRPMHRACSCSTNENPAVRYDSGHSWRERFADCGREAWPDALYHAAPSKAPLVPRRPPMQIVYLQRVGESAVGREVACCRGKTRAISTRRFAVRRRARPFCLSWPDDLSTEALVGARSPRERHGGVPSACSTHVWVVRLPGFGASVRSVERCWGRGSRGDAAGRPLGLFDAGSGGAFAQLRSFGFALSSVVGGAVAEGTPRGVPSACSTQLERSPRAAAELRVLSVEHWWERGRRGDAAGASPRLVRRGFGWCVCPASELRVRSVERCWLRGSREDAARRPLGLIDAGSGGALLGFGASGSLCRALWERDSRGDGPLGLVDADSCGVA